MSTFDTYELSQRLSKPIELYHFYDGTDEWNYCTGTQDNFTFDGDIYTPASIKHEAIKQSQNPFDDVLTINADTALGIVTDSIGRFQSDRIYFKLIRIQNYNASLYENIWFGYISDYVYNDRWSEIKINSILASLNKRVVKEAISYQCRHVLYGGACGLDESTNKTNGTITGITDGTTIFATEFSTGTADEFLGSIIVTSDGEKRTIIQHAGGTSVRIIRPLSKAAVGTTFYVANKCDRTLDGSCSDLSNTDNYGGFLYYENNPYKEGLINTRSGTEIT